MEKSRTADDDAHNAVCNHLCGELRKVVNEMKRVSVLLEAAGYQNKYNEMSDAATMANEWADAIMDEPPSLPFYDMERLHSLMLANQTARNAVDVIEDMANALKELLYEATHLCPMEENGSHKCVISYNTLQKAIAALAKYKGDQK